MCSPKFGVNDLVRQLDWALAKIVRSFGVKCWSDNLNLSLGDLFRHVDLCQRKLVVDELVRQNELALANFYVNGLVRRLD